MKRSFGVIQDLPERFCATVSNAGGTPPPADLREMWYKETDATKWL